MTRLLERAVDVVRDLDAADQDWIANAMLSLAGRAPTEQIDPAHLEDVLAGLDEARQGSLASDEDVEAAFRRFRD